MGHGTQNNPWMKLMGIVSHKDRRHDNQQSGQGGSNERTLNQYVFYLSKQKLSIIFNKIQALQNLFFLNFVNSRNLA